MFDKKYLSKLKKTPGWPSEKKLNQGPVVVIECLEEIPCNPCETICKKGAIEIGCNITNLPKISDECNGCGKCIAYCPGQAIFIVDKTYSNKEASISIPYELLPFPKKGDIVMALDREGKDICKAKVIRVNNNQKNNKTNVVTISVPKKNSDIVRFFKPMNS